MSLWNNLRESVEALFSCVVDVTYLAWFFKSPVPSGVFVWQPLRQQFTTWVYEYSKFILDVIFSSYSVIQLYELDVFFGQYCCSWWDDVRHSCTLAAVSCSIRMRRVCEWCTLTSATRSIRCILPTICARLRSSLHIADYALFSLCNHMVYIQQNISIALSTQLHSIIRFLFASLTDHIIGQ